MIKKICCIILSVLLVTSTCGMVYAKQETENAQVLFRDIKINVNGNVLNPDTEPFIYQGRTYIPARALAEAMGGFVTWDNTSGTVSIYDWQSETISNYYAAICLLGASARLTEISDSINLSLNISLYEPKDSYVYNSYYDTFKIVRDSFYDMKSYYLILASSLSDSVCAENKEAAEKLLTIITLVEKNLILLSDLYVSYDVNKHKEFADNRSAIAINNANIQSVIYEYATNN